MARRFYYEAIAEAAKGGRPLVIFDFVDKDSSGRVMGDTTRRRMLRYADELGLEIREIVRVALTREQVDAYHIPTRPQKETTHRRPDDDPEVAELDAVLALHPGLLEQWITEAVDAYWTHEDHAPCPTTPRRWMPARSYRCRSAVEAPISATSLRTEMRRGGGAGSRCRTGPWPSWC